MRIANLAQIPPGEGRTFDLDGLRIAIFHTRAGQVFATQANCPHRDGPLADGLTDDATVVCPLHDRIYDLRTGAGSDCSLKTYPLAIGNDGEIVMTTQPVPVLASTG